MLYCNFYSRKWHDWLNSAEQNVAYFPKDSLSAPDDDAAMTVMMKTHEISDFLPFTKLRNERLLECSNEVWLQSAYIKTD